MTSTTEKGPLAGLRVIDASTILAGPLTCQILGDFGADVVKVEHPTRWDGLRGHGLQKDGHHLWWKMLGRNKRSTGIDLKTDAGADVFRRLVSSADVLVENFRPGTLERWGLGPEDLSRENPGLITLRVTGFGQSGPYATRPAFGTLVEAMSGFAHLTGLEDGPPTLPAFGLADSIAGMAGVAAVMMALHHRDTVSGRGQVIDLSLLEPIMTAVGPALVYADQLGIDLHRTGNRSLNNAPRNTYRTSDGHWLAVSTSADRIARRVMELVGAGHVVDEPWFASGGGRAEHADELDGYVAEWIGARPRDVVVTAFDDAGAAIAPVYRPSELLNDPQVRAREMVTAVDDPDLGPMRMQNVLWRMADTPGRIRFTGQERGAATDEILAELGYSSDDVAALRRDGSVA